MRTSCKMYRFCFYFSKSIPEVAEDGTHKIRVICRSVAGAEKYARRYAQIFAKSLHTPTKCVTEYNTTTGRKTREIVFTEGEKADEKL